jgi:hypothetical protein
LRGAAKPSAQGDEAIFYGLQQTILHYPLFIPSI